MPSSQDHNRSSGPVSDVHPDTEMATISSSNMTGKAELVREDPGKASDLIQKFNTPKPSASTTVKPRVAGKKISEDRLKFLHKDDSSSGVAPPSQPSSNTNAVGSGDLKWSKRLEEEQRQRKEAAEANKAKDEDAKAQSLEAELEKASLECAERSRRLAELRERYQMLSNEFSDVRELLGIAKSAQLALRNADRRASLRDRESEQDIKDREECEKMELMSQATEMREKLVDLMNAENRCNNMQSQLKKMTTELKAKDLEVEATQQEIENLTDTVKDLNSQMENMKAKWTESAQNFERTVEEQKSQLSKFREDLEIKEREVVDLKMEHQHEITELRDRLQSQSETFNIDLTNAQQDTGMMRKEISDLTESLEHIRSERMTLEAQLNDSQSQNIALENHQLRSIEIVEHNLKEAKTRVAAIESENTRKELETKSLNEAHDDLKEKLNDAKQAIEEGERTIKELQSKCEALEDVRVTLADKNDSLQGELRSGRGKISTLEEEMKKLETELRVMSEERGHAFQELNLKEEALMLVKDELSTLEDEMKELQSRADSRESELLQLKNEASALHVVMEESKIDVQAFSAQKAELEAQVANSLHHVTDLKMQKYAVEDELKASKANLLSLQQSKNEADQKLVTIIDEQASASEESLGKIKSLTSEFESLSSELSRKVADINTKTHALHKVESDLAEAKRRADEANMKAEEAEGETKRHLDTIELLRSDLKSQTLSLEKLEYDATAMVKERDDENERRVTLERNESEMLSKIKSLEALVSTLEGKTIDLVAEMAPLQEELKNAKSELEQVKLEAVEAKNEVHSLQQSHGDLDMAFRELQKKNQLTVEELNQTRMNQDQRDAAVKYSEEIASQLQQDKSQLESDLIHSQAKVDALLTTIDDSKRYYDQMLVEHLAQAMESSFLSRKSALKPSQVVESIVTIPSQKRKLGRDKAASLELNVLTVNLGGNSSLPEVMSIDDSVSCNVSDKGIDNQTSTIGINNTDGTKPPPTTTTTTTTTTNISNGSARGPSLASYVEALNHRREELADRESKFVQRLAKARTLEESLVQRETAMQQKSRRIKEKEEKLYEVVTSLKDRESELKIVSENFRRFSDRLSRSCWDRDSGTLLNKTISRPVSQEGPRREDDNDGMITEVRRESENQIPNASALQQQQQSNLITVNNGNYADDEHSNRPRSEYNYNAETFEVVQEDVTSGQSIYLPPLKPRT